MVLINVITTLNPYLVRYLIQYTGSREDSAIRKGVGFALGVSFMYLASSFFTTLNTYYSQTVGARMRAVLIQAIYEKSLRLSNKARITYTNGKVTNMSSVDCHRIDFAMQWFHYTWTFPIAIGISIAIIIINIGPSGLLGLAVIFIAFFVIMLLGKTMFSYRGAISKITDKRVTSMREILNSMKIIKYYSWESAYIDKITDIRNQELKLVSKMLYLRNGLSSVFNSVSSLAGLVSFVLLSGIGKSLNPATVFSSLSIFNVLKMPIMILPISFMTSIDAFQAQGRIRDLLSAPEMVDYLERVDYSEPEAIKFSDASFIWETEDKEEEESSKDKKEEPSSSESSPSDDLSPILSRQISTVTSIVSRHEDVKVVSEQKEKEMSSSSHELFPGINHADFSIKRGEFVVVTGPIGSGKSSLLSAIAGTMFKTQGSVRLAGSLAYCGSPWIQNSTIKGNIVFGNDLDQEWYDTVVKCCSLERDFELFAGGDNTEVGERGLTLSGGQKARINLARAVYRDSDVILLDDVLSAVDAHVGKFIMDNCITGILKKKTRVLATHQISIIDQADRVIFLDGKGSVIIGTPSELRASNTEFDGLMKLNDSNTASDPKAEKGDTNSPDKENEEESIEEKKDIDASAGALMQAEEKNEKAVPLEVYLTFVKYGTGFFKYWFIPIYIFFITLATFCQIFSNTWLSFWTERKFARSSGFYSGIFVLLTLMSVILLFAYFTINTVVTKRTSKKIHIMALAGILHSPMHFFDSSPLGRILNRFSHDTDTLDNEVADQIRMFLTIVANIVGVFILVIIYIPWFALALAFLLCLFFTAASYYRSSAREIKRLDSTGRSVVVSHFSETLTGVPTIVAYGVQDQFIKSNNRAINRMNAAYFLTIVNQSWLSLRLDLVSTGILIFVTMLCVTHKLNISPSVAGLLVSYLLQVVGLLTFLVRELATVENNMNSVERLYHYATKLEQESAYHIPETAPPPEWPQYGAIKFDDVSLAYQPTLPPVLKNINIDIKPGEKIGICGRTGAGKSTIMTALYRIVELQKGRIDIDGIDISTLGLNELRSKLAIIPQDPVLFQGTIRSNIDPFGLSSDKELWDALRNSWLLDSSEYDQVNAADPSKSASNMKFHLDANVEDDGNNFSLGERQLVALTRALVRNSQILILDEATSSVDYHTDNKIQSTIASNFKHCTILCIAHRLRTILNYDRILVLEAGEVVEFDTPKNLFNNVDGVFRSMCNNSGITSIE